jgi:hypothetical protein
MLLLQVEWLLITSQLLVYLCQLEPTHDGGNHEPGFAGVQFTCCIILFLITVVDLQWDGLDYSLKITLFNNLSR